MKCLFIVKHYRINFWVGKCGIGKIHCLSVSVFHFFSPTRAKGAKCMKYKCKESDVLSLWRFKVERKEMEKSSIQHLIGTKSKTNTQVVPTRNLGTATCPFTDSSFVFIKKKKKTDILCLATDTASNDIFYANYIS